jgi:diadenylate cyclase
VETLIDYFHRVAGYDWWVIAIELFFIGLIVYWAVDFLEGTRGERLFRGVILILFTGVLILYFIVQRFHFERLEYLYKGFLLAVLVVAVAAFQPEIRRALIRLGQPGFFASASPQLSKTTNEIITAIRELSATKTGAIIVIERAVGLGEFIETGIRIDSVVSSELLKTIFWPGTPLHDMAVVIRGDRIVAARIQLPLAEAGAIHGMQLGSRHRAAIGISATSDCVVIVVSEETGGISIAENGILNSKLGEQQFRERLSMLTKEDRSGYWFWKRQKKDQNFDKVT